jgi:hypothetical protein
MLGVVSHAALEECMTGPESVEWEGRGGGGADESERLAIKSAAANDVRRRPP